jgi:O-antigen/teichoic acid export membrane protein
MATEAFVSRLVRQSFHSAVMSAVRLTSRLLLSVALGKSLTAEEYGVYSLVAASMAMIGYFLQLGAHQYYMREVPGRAPV